MTKKMRKQLRALLRARKTHKVYFSKYDCVVLIPAFAAYTPLSVRVDCILAANDLPHELELLFVTAATN